MNPQGRIWLTDAEVATIRRSLQTVEEQVEALRAGRPTELVVVRLRAAVDGLRHLLERAEERRDVN